MHLNWAHPATVVQAGHEQQLAPDTRLLHAPPLPPSCHNGIREDAKAEEFVVYGVGEGVSVVRRGGHWVLDA